MPAQTPAQARGSANRMGEILRGPHLRVLEDFGDGPFVMVEPLRYFRVVNPMNGGRHRVARVASA